MNQTTNKTTANTPLSFKWEADKIFDANFMFPTDHFKDLKALESATEEAVSETVIGMLSACQPLCKTEQEGMVAAVKSGNRLRTYFFATSIVKHRAEVLNETQVLGDADAKLGEIFDHHAFQIKEEGVEDFVDKEFQDC